MALVKCKACSKRYDYHEHGCCPECGAYNRPPQRNRVGLDGVVHRMSDADFLDNTAKRRASQNGKVCFEQDVCFEDQARKVRGDKKSPFTVERSGRAQSKKSGPAKVLKIAIAVIVLVNILPLSLTMCSVSGVFEDIVDELFSSEVGWDEPVEEPLHTVPARPDLSGAELITFGQTFQWGDEMACVMEMSMDEDSSMTNIILTVQTADPVEKPLVYYLLMDGTQAVAECLDATYLSSEKSVYYIFNLPNRQPGSTCYALFTGLTDGEWRIYELPLN